MTCTWDTDIGCLGAQWDTFTPEVQARSLMLATSALQALTLYRVGTCPITIRPVGRRSRCGCSRYSERELVSGNNCCHGNRIRVSEVEIPGPVGYIDQFLIDGRAQPLDNGNWRLDDGYKLVWQGIGPSPIPHYQDLSKPDTAVGTWSITYSRSYPVLEDARIAVSYLAVEFAKGCLPKSKCALPRNITSLVRAGVSFTMTAGLFPNGLTNIDQTDQFILKWAPGGSPTQSAQVFDPTEEMPRVTSAVPMRAPAGSV